MLDNAGPDLIGSERDVLGEVEAACEIVDRVAAER
jgi:hypothetical protein